MLKLPRAAEREYLAIYGIVAVYVAAVPSGESIVGYSRDLLHSLLTLRRQWRSLHISCAYWVRDRREARLIANEVNARLLRHPERRVLLADAKAAQRTVENVAAHMGIAITEHDLVLMRTRSAVAYVEEKLAQAQAAGELHEFNRNYRQWRLAARSVGRGMSYSEARARLRRKLFQEILLGDVQMRSQELFPPLPGIDFSVPG